MATLISPEQARNIGHAVIDVREFPEYAAGAIKGSRLVPLSTVESEATKWNKAEPVLLVCRSGKRASQAAETLERLGFQNVNVLQGGFEAWKVAGLPTHVEEKKPWSLERQVRAIAGSMVLLFTVLGLLVSPYFLGLTLLVGAGLLFAGLTDVCMMATALGKLRGTGLPVLRAGSNQRRDMEGKEYAMQESAFRAKRLNLVSDLYQIRFLGACHA